MSIFAIIGALFSRSPVPAKASPAPATQEPPQPATQPGQYKPSVALIACVGAVCAQLLVTSIPQYEGVKLEGYRDMVGVPTKCMGDTSNVVVGRPYTVADCSESMSTQLVAHAAPVLQCTPGLKGHPYQLAAAVSLAYNIGVGAYCRSNIAAAFNAGKLSAACKLFPEYDMAGGKVVPGLLTRRKSEEHTCLEGLS